MKCSFCGKELKDGATFCSFCGTKVTSGAATNTATAEEWRAPRKIIAQETPVKEKNKGKKHRGLIIGCIVLAVVVLVTSLAIGIMPLFDNGNTYPPCAVQAYVDSNGNAYFCYDNGERAIC